MIMLKQTKMLIALALLVLTPRLALAQQSARPFTELQSTLKIGDRVRVTDSSGKTTQGQVAGVAMDSLNLTVDGRQLVLPEAAIQQVTRRRHDPPATGALLGGVIGAVSGLVVKRVNCGSTDCGEGGIVDPGFVLIGAGMGAGLGALVDRAISRFDTVFTRPSVAGGRGFKFAPVLSRGMKGVSLSVTF